MSEERKKKKKAWQKRYYVKEPLKGEFQATIKASGNSFQITLPSKFMQYNNLKAGDKLNIRIDEGRRLVEEDAEP